jgi:hypothetical protein
MLTLLGGQSGGVWSGPSPTAGNYNPATMVQGIYTYTKSGMAPCLADVATVTVTEIPKPEPGISNSIDVCADDDAFNMTDSLLGTPSALGSWTNPFSQATDAIYDPGLDPPGVYTYTVTGTSPCQNGIATLTIEENEAPYPANPHRRSSVPAPVS